MIKPEELRLNNKVSSIPHKGLITEIRDLSPTSLKLWANPFADYKYEDIEPIPLSPEILEQVGFIRYETLDVVHLEKYIDVEDEATILLYMGDKNGICEVVIDLETQFRIAYLHQLQNWHYLLTNTELSINILNSIR